LLVLGYARTTNVKEASITVPPFHTGHLGFVPDTPVRISLVDPPMGGLHREVVVTPFNKDVRDLAAITVAMRDEVGVVARLVGAVAALGINIEVLESSSIKLLDNHSVTLLVDLSGASLPTGTEISLPAPGSLTPTAIRRLYQGYDSVFPVRDFVCMHLFESIVAHCADVIDWKTISGEPFPDIDIRRYPQRRLSTFVVEPLVRVEGRPLHVKIDLPKAITHRLRHVLGADGQFEYLLVSDTTTRALHAFFLHPDFARRILHVGFVHDDVPGALATILDLLREAEFNILTSLVRKEGDGRSVCEAVLEYQGTAEIPSEDSRQAHSPVTQAELDWICEQIVAAHAGSEHDAIDCGIVVAPPRYPARKAGTEPAMPVPLSDRIEPISHAPGIEPRYEPDRLLLEQLEALDAHGRGHQYAGETRQLLKLIQKRHAEHGRSGIFLSYPHSAADHGEALYQRLNGPYRVDRYQEPDGEAIPQNIIDKIEGCDYFIGIWHYEGSPGKGRTKESRRNYCRGVMV
jgi:ACT domain-containing protein